jgi:RNA polymerase sigma-70 factor, ECF subfamily
MTLHRALWRMRLFDRLARLQLRMSATSICAPLTGPTTATALSGSFRQAALAGPASLLFSTFMADDTKSLALGLKRRDPELLDALIEQYQYRLFRYLLYITGNRERAEDFFQETWIRVLERGHQYDGKSKFEAWLFSIARHLVIDWQRQKKAQSLDALTSPEEGAPMEFPGDNPSPLHLVLTSESEATVQASLEKLPAIYREVLLLRFQEELGLVEIATVLSAPLSTVKSRLYRGLEDLRSLLAGEAA